MMRVVQNTGHCDAGWVCLANIRFASDCLGNIYGSRGERHLLTQHYKGHTANYENTHAIAHTKVRADPYPTYIVIFFCVYSPKKSKIHAFSTLAI